MSEFLGSGSVDPLPVSWEWDQEHIFGPTWYRDPEDDSIKQAWISSSEFVGRDLDKV
jgi:hypothetical protein